MQTVKKDEPDVKVKSIFCFTGDPEMREKGIAAQLLRRVCDDAATDVFDFIEAYETKSLSIRQRILWERPVYTKRRTLSHVMKPAASM